MKKLFLVLLIGPLALLRAETPKPATLRTILLEQLRTTHNQQDWFVPASIAVAGLTPEQAKWTSSAGNHSIGQIANHLLFWNTQELARFNGEAGAAYNGNNDETFNSFDSASWTAVVQKLDAVLTAWEKAVEAADDQKLQKSASLIAHVGAHNAYHTGQIMYIRKMQGAWDASKGVK